MDTIQIEGFCEDCATRKTCSKPCKPVETWLRHGRSMVFESKEGDYTVLFSQYNEIKFSELNKHLADQDQSYLFADRIDKAEKVIPIHPKQQRAKIFYEHFFGGKPYKNIAEETDLPVHHVRAIFADAKRRLLRIVEVLDGRDYGLKHVQTTKKFSNDEKWFLMVKCFGYSVAEISRMPGTPQYGTLKRRIWKMHNKYSEKFTEVAGEAI